MDLFLEVLEDLSRILAEVNVDALRLRLQDPVFVPHDEPHL